jgi:hypothetical protein
LSFIFRNCLDPDEGFEDRIGAEELQIILSRPSRPIARATKLRVQPYRARQLDGLFEQQRETAGGIGAPRATARRSRPPHTDPTRAATSASKSRHLSATNQDGCWLLPCEVKKRDQTRGSVIWKAWRTKKHCPLTCSSAMLWMRSQILGAEIKIAGAMASMSSRIFERLVHPPNVC